jgi:dimethylargininase
VLRCGRVLYVGATARTDAAGAASLRQAVGGFGFDVRVVPVTGCLHLKSAATTIGDGVLLFNPAWVDPEHFGGCRLIAVDPSEPFAANALRIGNAVLHGAQFPRTAAMLRSQGFEVVPVEADELAKAEGGVTCCSILIEG